MSTLRATLQALAVTLGLTVVLTGCVTAPSPDPSPTSSQETTMIDPEQARADLYAQLDAAQTLVGGEWGNSDDSSPMTCTLGGVEGFTFTGTRRSNEAATEDSLAAVAALWNGMGFSAEVKENVGPYRVVVATSTSDPSNVLRFGLGEQAMYLEGQGACGEGDAYEYLIEKEKQAEGTSGE
jgi:hypothetical protein